MILKMVEKYDARHKMADALEEVIQVKKFSKITVTDITDKSGVSRQTFYHYFKDIYDIVNWIHTDRIQLSFDIFAQTNDVVASFYTLFKMMRRYKNFYRYAIELEGPNSFSDYYKDAFINGCKNDIGEANLNQELLLAINFFAEGTTQLIMKWIRGNMTMPPITFARYLSECVPGNLKRYYNAGID